MPEHPSRDGSITATGCAVCAAPLTGRADQRFCSPACRQAAHRRRTNSDIVAPAVPARRPRREHTIYECDECGERLAGQQWCPQCQRPCRRIDYGGNCPSCGEPITINDLIEVPTP